ncbi:hypothetical protein DAEQUDRAFT_765173 [Daedalea quercina L-15889]|uniref:F-box domain-containing protein n=1 Tax=Daedalea quercina L-15889 TaxID=1314783 RepID=A0A165QS34_9APHY|nr:hypothetical protein DAEQUDRAFT_765173 [Daedalea quercina L-15889]
MSSASGSSPANGGGDSLPITDPSSRSLALSWFGYHPAEFDETVLLKHAPPYLTQREATQAANEEPSPSPVTPIGELSRFPLELLSFIVQFADLQSISVLRLVNRRMRLIVDDSIPYKFLIQHIPDTLSALKSADATQHFTVDELYVTLCRKSCAFCKDMGTYLWIPECVRCCFNCLNETPHLMPLIESDAKTLFGVTKKVLSDIPSMLSIPGTYGMVELYHGRRFRLYSQTRVVQAAIAHHGGDESYNAWLETDGMKARVAFSRPSRRGISKPTFYLSARFMAATPLPYFDLATRKLHHGLVCRGCQIAMIRSRHLMATHSVAMTIIRKQARMWVEDNLFEHFGECKDAQDMWDFMHEARNVSVDMSREKTEAWLPGFSWLWFVYEL